MDTALQIPFERTVLEYALWRSIPDDERSGAPAWWWDTALSVIDKTDIMPAHWCQSLELESGSTYAAAAKMLMASMHDQDVLVYPENFPRKPKKQD